VAAHRSFLISGSQTSYFMILLPIREYYVNIVHPLDRHGKVKWGVQD